MLGGKQLKAVYDNDEDEMLIEAVDSVKDIVISHKMVSETKIPGKQQANELMIWDCPGFFDMSCFLWLVKIMKAKFELKFR